MGWARVNKDTATELQNVKDHIPWQNVVDESVVEDRNQLDYRFCFEDLSIDVHERLLVLNVQETALAHLLMCLSKPVWLSQILLTFQTYTSLNVDKKGGKSNILFMQFNKANLGLLLNLASKRGDLTCDSK